MRDTLMFVAHWAEDLWGVWEIHIKTIEGELDEMPEYVASRAESITYAGEVANERQCTYGMSIAGELKGNAAYVDPQPRRDEPWEPDGDQNEWGVREL